MHQRLPELGPRQHPRSVQPLRTVPARVSVVPCGPADWTHVAPQDGTQHFPVVGSQRVWAVHPCRLPVLSAEAALVRGGPGGAAVRQAAGCAALLRNAPLRCGLLLWLPGTSVVHLTPVTHPLQQPAQVHVVLPHIEAVSVVEDRALDRDSSFHCGHF